MEQSPFAAHGWDPVNKELAFQMIVLVLDDSGEQPVGIQGEGLAFFIVSLDGDGSGPLYNKIQAGEREATFLVLAEFGTRHDNFGVDEDAPFIAFHIRDEKPLFERHLRRGEADAVVAFHRLKHLCDGFSKPLIEFGDGVRFLFEYFVAVGYYFKHCILQFDFGAQFCAVFRAQGVQSARHSGDSWRIAVLCFNVQHKTRTPIFDIKHKNTAVWQIWSKAISAPEC